MYVEKTRPVGTIPRLGGRGIREKGEGGEFNYDTL
jgi:hypothetical protein